MRQLAACTHLRELEAELSCTVRDDALLRWRALGAMRTLRLAANFYISEAACAAVLAAMPGLRVSRNRGEAMQGSAMLQASRTCGAGSLTAVPLVPHTPPAQELRLELVQGSGSMLAPLAGMPLLRCLELASCHLNDAHALGAALRSATGLACLRIQVSCHVPAALPPCLAPTSCGA